MKERLIQILSDNSLTYSGMAERIGYTDRAVYSWVTERNKPTVDAVIAICKEFHISADWLLFGEDK